MGDFDDDFEDWRREEDRRALSRKGIAEQNAYLLRRYRDFRLAADAITAAWRRHAAVRAIALIGSTAAAPYKEIPRFQPYRRARVELWHECKDFDLALWLDRLDELDALRRAKAKALRDFHERTDAGVADHQADVFILAPGSDRYLGRLCRFNQCPKRQTRVSRARLRRDAVPAAARRFRLAARDNCAGTHARPVRSRVRPIRPRRRSAAASLGLSETNSATDTRS